MNSVEKLLSNNKKWAKGQVKADPRFFKRLEALQSPEFLWIGCSDSRVPANQITGTQPGQVFVHRNIANLVIPTDLNMLSVVNFSVNMLKVKHIIVCGHYGCGGIQAAMSGRHFGLLDKWLSHIKRIYSANKKELQAIPDIHEREHRLVELNVMHHVDVLAGLPVIREAWERGQKLSLHGWVYSLSNGIIKPLVEIEPGGKKVPSKER